MHQKKREFSELQSPRAKNQCPVFGGKLLHTEVGLSTPLKLGAHLNKRKSNFHQFWKGFCDFCEKVLA